MARMAVLPQTTDVGAHPLGELYPGRLLKDTQFRNPAAAAAHFSLNMTQLNMTVKAWSHQD